MAHVADAALGDPAADGRVVRAEAVILVHHEAHALADIGDERLGLGDRLGQRLLAHDVDVVIRREPRKRRVGAHRGGDVDRVEAAIGEHRPGVVIDPPDAELAGAGLRLGAVGVADGGDFGTSRLPAAQMIEADQAATCQRDAQAAVLRHLRSSGCGRPARWSVRHC